MPRVCVLGLGYIGLPTACMFATHGFDVVGVDVNEEIIAKLRAGAPHIHEPGLTSLFETAVKSGRLTVTTSPEPADAFVIAVPTPTTENKIADLRYVESAAESLLPVLEPGNLVILESTSPPGTTCNLLASVLAQTRLKVGEELYIAYCPERVLPGRIVQELLENNRIIGGMDLESAERAKALYSCFVEGMIYLTDATTAEMTKLVENTFRDVNIALANELAVICEEAGISAWEVIALANKHPRVNVHRPGPGVGGHCLPVDPWFLVEQSPDRARLIRLGREINDHQPYRVAQIITQMTDGVSCPKIAVLGVSYKADTDDARCSPSRVLMQWLTENGYAVAAHDPYVSNFAYELSPLEETCRDADCVVIMVRHSQYGDLTPSYLAGLVRTKQVVDTCNLLGASTFQASGFRVWLLGAGWR